MNTEIQLKAAVLGHPVAQSLSPRLHGYWLERYGIAGSYEAIDTPPEQLAETLLRLQAEGYAGCNLTVPLKEAVLSLLDEIDPVAAAIGAVNTVVFRDGRMVGYNTDAYGFMRNLEFGVRSSEFRKNPITHCVILGAGGAARAVVAGLIDAGAGRITLLNRSQDKVEKLAAAFDNVALEVKSWEQRNQALSGATLLVNTTSLGMSGQPPLEIALDALPLHALVTDIVYKPLETALLKQALERGNPVVDGLGMLLYQAEPAFEHFFGIRPEVTAELRQIITG